MNCFQCERNLSAYLDDELPMGERLEIETHLDDCDTCRAEFESHQTSWEAAHQVSAEAAPDGLWNGIVEQLDDGGSGTAVEEVALMVKGLAAEIAELKGTIDELRLTVQQSRWAAGESTDAFARDTVEDIRVRSNPFRAVHPREARQPANIDQLRQTS